MRTEIVSTSSRMAEVGTAWDALWQRCGGGVFQSHGWVSAWWDSQPADGKQRLCVGLCWVGDALVAAMPFTTRRHRGVRVLEWAAKDCSDYCDALADCGAAEGRRALKDAWAAVVASGGFDLIYLSHLRPDAVLRGLLDGPRPGLRLRLGRRSARSLQVRNDGRDGTSWFRGLDEETRDNHTRGMRIIGEDGPVAVEVLGLGDAAGPALERMIELKRRWLADTGQGEGILGNDARVLRALVQELVRQRALQMFEVSCGGRVVAVLLNIVAGTRTMAFLTACDTRFEPASPETLLLVEYIIRAFDMGITEVDLLCVAEDQRFSFANARVELASYVGARTFVGRLALMIGERLDRARG